jgi:hypothetical protein
LYTDPLLGNDRETKNEATAIDMQPLRKYARIVELFVNSYRSNNGSTVGSGVFYVVRSKAM